MRWEANRGGTRDRGEFQGCDATPETGRKPKNVVKRDRKSLCKEKRKQIESRKNKEKQRNNFKKLINTRNAVQSYNLKIWT